MNSKEMSERVSDAIDRFFDGIDYFMNESKYTDVGQIWVCRHKGFDTLTVEPREGGQYEVAIRIRVDGEWKGYSVRFVIKNEAFLCGHNTGGH